MEFESYVRTLKFGCRGIFIVMRKEEDVKIDLRKLGEVRFSVDSKIPFMVSTLVEIIIDNTHCD